jgi:hypothetical protein
MVSPPPRLLRRVRLLLKNEFQPANNQPPDTTQQSYQMRPRYLWKDDETLA